MSKQRRCRQQALPLPASRSNGPRAGERPPASLALAHRHGRGHLAPRGSLRCGCGPEALGAENPAAGLAGAPATTWAPLRRQLAGFVRAHFIYSDRMPCPSA
jgi:hypothetical protein